MIKVNVLGTEYRFAESDLNNPEMATNDGICHLDTKDIIVRKPEYMGGSTEEGRNERFYHVLRHELIHAFAHESGVQYGEDEDLVDWIAHMIPKINTAVYDIIDGCKGDSGTYYDWLKKEFGNVLGEGKRN